MAAQSGELHLGRILVRLGSITDTQLSESCAALGDESGLLVETLVSKGTLSFDHLQTALQEQKRLLAQKPFEAVQQDTHTFVERAQEAGLVSPGQIETALQAMERGWEAERLIRHPGEVLVEQAVLSADRLAEFMGTHGLKLKQCGICRSSFETPIAEGAPNISTCLVCGGRLRAASLESPQEQGEILDVQAPDVVESDSTSDASATGALDSPVSAFAASSQTTVPPLADPSSDDEVSEQVLESPEIPNEQHVALQQSPTEQAEGAGEESIPDALATSSGGLPGSDAADGSQTVPFLADSASTDGKNEQASAQPEGPHTQFWFDIEQAEGAGEESIPDALATSPEPAPQSAFADDSQTTVSTGADQSMEESASERDAPPSAASAHLAGMLEHPNILPVDSAGTVRGQPLDRVLAGQHLQKFEPIDSAQLNEMLLLFLKVCDAVAFAHSKGVVHGNLEPANITVGEFGEVLVTEWNRARILSEDAVSANDAATTVTDKAQGTQRSMNGASYTAPEKLRGDASEIGRGSDIYSLGAVLYEQLALVPPYQGINEADVGAESLGTKLLPPEHAAPLRQIPAELSKVCLIALAYEKADRYPSVVELANNVRRYLGGRVVSAGEGTAVRPDPGPAKPRKLVLAASGAVLVIGAILLGFMLRPVIDEEGLIAVVKAKLFPNDGQGLDEGNQGKEQSATASNLDSVKRGLAEREEYGRSILSAQQLIEGSDFKRAQEVLAATPRALRGWEWWRLQHQCRKRPGPIELEGHLHPITSVAFSPDGLCVLTGSRDMTAKIWDAETGRQVLTLTGHEHVVQSVAYAPDGQRVVTGSLDNTAKLWDAGNGRVMLTLKGHTSGVNAVAFSPDGRRVATGSQDTTARIWDAESGDEIHELKGHSSDVNSVAFSHDGRYLLTAGSDRTARIWDAQTRKEVLALEGDAKRLRSAVFSPDGRRVLTAGDDRAARIWDAYDANVKVTFAGHIAHLNCARFSPDGQRVLTGSKDNTAAIWDAKTGYRLMILKCSAAEVHDAAFSPTGRRLAFALGRTAQVLLAEDGERGPDTKPSRPLPSTEVKVNEKAEVVPLD